MVQSLKLGGAANDEAESGIKRINRLPIIVVIVLVIAFLGVIFYGLASRGLYFGKDSGPETSSGNPASTFADQIKRGVTDGIIGEPQQQTTFQPTPVETKQDEKANNPFTPQPGQNQEQQRGQELENEAVWRARLEREQREQYLRERHRQRMARLQANRAAYEAPLAIDRSKLEARDDETTSARAATNTSTTVGATSDLYAAALRAGLGGQNVDPNGQSSKEDFFNADLKDLGYLPNRVVPQQSPYELKRGSVIPATLISGINSDLPGRITAQVSQNVYDSATGHRLLIPQGTKLFGRYDSKVSFGQSRVLVVWSDIIFPNGSTLQIGGMAGNAAGGAFLGAGAAMKGAQSASTARAEGSSMAGAALRGMASGIGNAGWAAGSAAKEKAIASPGAYAGSLLGLANAKLDQTRQSGRPSAPPPPPPVNENK
uniref:IncP-type conjugal transfer protein TrbI n=1 Tax=Agrobacterium deltaense TaxID=1183412 RepID=UPI00155DC2EE|nr:IncP-type conjugal transfer protein TrbI [Agrobacterium deltaense]